MKLHLPKLLRNAVLACVTAVVGFVTTVGTAAFTGGVVAFTLAAPQALADYTWNGGSGNKTKEDWNNAANWELNGAAFAGSGPGTPDSNMWEAIHLNGGTEGLVIGAADEASRVELEGWQPTYNLDSNTTLYATAKKFQGTSSISVDNGSTLDLIHKDGHFQALTVNIGAGSEMILTMTNNKDNGALTLNLNAADAMMTFASNNTDVRTLSGAITVTTKLGDIDAGTMSRQKLGLATQNVTLSNLSFNFGDEWVRTETEITEANYATLAGKYYIDIVDGEYYVVYSKAPACVWEGGDLSWGADTVFSNDLQFTDGTNVNFRGADAQVTLIADVQANVVSIAEGIKVGLTGNNSLTAETISLSENAQLDLLKKSVLASGLVKMADGAQLNIAVGGSTTIQDVLGDSVTWSGGAIGITNGTTIELADDKLNNSNVVVDGEGSCVNVTNSAATFNKNVKLQNSAVMELATDVGSDRFSWGSAQKIEVLSGSELKLNNSRVSVQAADQIILNNGKITGAGDANGALDFFENGGVLVSDGTSSIEGPVRLRTAGETTTFQVNSGTLTAGSFVGNGSLEKTGAGTMVISGAADYVGSTTISAGELVLQGATNTNKGLFTIAENATLTIDEGANRTIIQTISGAGTLNLNGTLTINFAEYTVPGDAGMTYSDGENGYATNLLVASMGQITKGEDSSVVVINGEETNTYASSDITITDGKMFVGFSGGESLYYVNTDVTYNAETMGDVTEFYMMGNSIFRVSDISVLTRTSSQNSTSNLYLDAAGETLTAEAASGYSGNIIITAGTTVQAAVADSLGVNHVNNKERSIVVENGATLEVGADTYYKVVLNEGATMANRTGQANSSESMQNPYIDLQGDATIDAQSTFGMRYAGADSTQRETLNLNGHTLTKTGAGDFFFFNTTINAGTIDVKEGLIDVKGGSGFANVDARLQSGTALVASANDKGWKSLTLYSGETDGGAVEVRTNGTNQLTIHNGITADVRLDKKEGGNLIVNGTSTLGAGVTISAGTLTLNGASSLGSVLTIESGATLAMGENGTITLSSLSGFEGVGAQDEIPTTNGLVEFESSYKIVDNKNENNANSNLTSVTYKGTSYELKADGNVDIVGNTYYVVEGGEDKVVYVGGDTPTADTATATEFYVGEQGTLHIMGAASDDMAADRILKSTSGTGTIKLSSNVELLDGSAIIHEGTLSIENNTSLVLGTNGGNNQVTYSVDLSSLESLDLNGGAIQIFYVAPTIQNMNVTAAGTISVFDVKPGATTNINFLNLADDLHISTTWKSDVCIGELSGEGDLVIAQMQGGERTISPLAINGFDNYGGTVTVSDQGGHKVALSLKINEGQSLRSEQLNVAGGNATAVLKGAGTYDLGSSLTLNPRVSLSDEWTGVVSTSDVVVNGSADTSALSNSNSTLNISGLSVESGGSLTLGGKVVLDGSVSIAATVTNNAELTMGDNFKLSVNEDMFVEGPGEDELMINLFTGTNAGVVAGMNTGMLSAELLERGEEGSWRFNDDGTIIFLDALAVAKLVWAGGDGELMGDNFADGATYMEDCQVTFGAVTDGNADTVTISDDANVRRFIVEEGGDYVFTGEGSLIMKDGLTIESGAKVNIELADGVSVGKNLVSAGDLKVSKITGTGNVEITGGSLELAGTDALANTGTKSISGAELKGTWTAAGVNLGTGVEVATDGNITLTDTSLAGTISNSGTLNLAGIINITPSADFQTQEGGVQYSDGVNGTKFVDVTYVIVSGEGTTNIASGAVWQVDGVAKGEYADGKLNVQGEQQGSLYWVNEGTVTYGAAGLAGTGLAMNGGSLVLNASLTESATDGIHMMVAGTVTVTEGVTLKAEQVKEASASTMLTLDGAGTYDIADTLELGTGVELADTWTGIVSTSATAALQQGADISSLGNALSTIAVNGNLTLGTLEDAATLTAGDSALSLNGTLALGNVGSFLQAGSLVLGDSFNFSLEDLLNAAREFEASTLISLNTALSDADKAKFEVIKQNAGKGGLYDYKTSWEGNNLVLTGVQNAVIWGGETESGSEEQVWDSSLTDEKDTLAFTGSGEELDNVVKVQGDVVVNNIKVVNIEEGKEDATYTLVGGSVTSAGDLMVGVDDDKGHLTVSNVTSFAGNATITEGSTLNIETVDADAASLVVAGDLNNAGTLVVGTKAALTVGVSDAVDTAGNKVQEVTGSLVTDRLIIKGELQHDSSFLVTVGNLANDVVIDLDDATTLGNLKEGSYNLMSVLGDTAAILLEYADMQSILSQGFACEGIDVRRPSAVSAALGSGSLSAPLVQSSVSDITLVIRELSDAERVWKTDADVSTAGLELGSLVNGTMVLNSNSALDTIKSVEVVQNTTLDLTGDSEGVVNLKGLVGDSDLSIKGNGDTVNITTVSTGYEGELALDSVKAKLSGTVASVQAGNGTQADLAVTDTEIVISGSNVELNGSMTDGTLVLNEGITVKGNLTITDTDIAIINSAEGTVMDVEAGSTVVIANLGNISGEAGDISVGQYDKDGDFVQSSLYGKYFSSYYLEDGEVLASRNTTYYTDKAGAGVSANGAAGLAMADAALVELNPQVDKKSDLGTVLSLLDKAGSEAADELGASLAGASTAVLGMAALGDVDRQLQAIRNRTTTMGVDQSTVREGMPYFNAWINAEGDFSELADDGTASGYQISSWGGTVGFDADLLPELTAGVALTAMHGDLDASGADKATGKLDTQYLSIFARYAPSAWTHTFVGTIGQSSISLDRTVAGIQTQGETDGMSFGLMYEAGRVYSLNEDGTTCLQPVFNVTWKHTAVDGYTEKGSDIALNVDDQTLDTVTFGLGARVQTVVGESMYNRTSILEARVLAKLDAGDRQGSSDVALAALPDTKTSVESAEMGAFGLEIGAGLTVPVGDVSGSIFADASLELRSDYTNVNGTIGYRVNF